MKHLPWFVVGCGLWLCGCSRQESPPAATPSSIAPGGAEPTPSLAALDRGARLFQEHCAQCHGPEAQGHPDWQTPGVTAAPPLNGTGNDWKRSRAELGAVIQNGSKRNGALVMPGWKGRLTEAEVNDLVAWFQALWPPETYVKWQKTQTAGAGK
jgi:mono/diheme cytochrome c family protein